MSIFKEAPDLPITKSKEEIDKTYRYWRLHLMIVSYIGFAGWGSDKFFKGNRTQMNIIYVVGIISVSLALWFLPSDNVILMSSLFFLIGFFIFGPQFLIAMAAAENSHKYASGASTGFVSLFAYIGAVAAGLPLSLVIEHFKWNGFFGTLFMISLVCALLLVLVYILQYHKNKQRSQLQG